MNIKIIIDLLLLTIIITYTVGISGFIDVLKEKIWGVLYKPIPYNNWSLKPFDCPICLTFWIGLIYLFIIKDITLLNITIVCLYSLFQPVINNILIIIKELLIKLTNKF
jgi:hypothetical protein